MGRNRRAGGAPHRPALQAPARPRRRHDDDRQARVDLVHAVEGFQAGKVRQPHIHDDGIRLLGAHDPSMGELVDATVRAMGAQYPELVQQRGRIAMSVVAEEAAFSMGLARYAGACPVAESKASPVICPRLLMSLAYSRTGEPDGTSVLRSVITPSCQRNARILWSASIDRPTI